MNPYQFGMKIAQELILPGQPGSDPLGVGPRPLTGGFGRAQLLSAPGPMAELLQNNRNVPRQFQSKPKPKTFDIRPNKPIRVIDPNKQTT